MKLEKYKQIVKKAKHNFHSKSELPSAHQISNAARHVQPQMMIVENSDRATPQEEERKGLTRKRQLPAEKNKPEMLQHKEVFKAPMNSLNTSIKMTPKDARIETQESIDSNLPPEDK